MLNGRLRQALSKTEVQHRARANTKTRKTHAVTFWNIKKRDSRKSFTRHVTVTPGNTSNPPSAIPDKAQTQPQDPESDSIPGKKKKKNRKRLPRFSAGMNRCSTVSQSPGQADPRNHIPGIMHCIWYARSDSFRIKGWNGTWTIGHTWTVPALVYMISLILIPSQLFARFYF